MNNLFSLGEHTQNTRNLLIHGGEPGDSQNAAVILEENGRISYDLGMGCPKHRVARISVTPFLNKPQ